MTEVSDNLEITHLPIAVEDSTVHVHILNLSGSAIVWVNSTNISMKNFVVSMQTPYSKNPSTLNLIGDYSSDVSINLAQRLCERTKKQIFVSCNFSENSNSILNKVEPFLVKELLK